jgi:hypothetical protein
MPNEVPWKMASIIPIVTASALSSVSVVAVGAIASRHGTEIALFINAFRDISPNDSIVSRERVVPGLDPAAPKDEKKPCSRIKKNKWMMFYALPVVIFFDGKDSLVQAERITSSVFGIVSRSSMMTARYLYLSTIISEFLRSHQPAKNLKFRLSKDVLQANLGRPCCVCPLCHIRQPRWKRVTCRVSYPSDTKLLSTTTQGMSLFKEFIQGWGNCRKTNEQELFSLFCSRRGSETCFAYSIVGI